jgi:hypothetical protein
LQFSSLQILNNEMLQPLPFRTAPVVFLSVLLIFSAVLTGCGGNIVLDNPRDESVTFAFDGNNEHQVKAGEQITIDLPSGDHSIEIRNNAGEVLADTSFRLRADDEGIVHSGASTYLVWRQLYGLQEERKTLLNERWVEFDSIRAFGDIKVYPPEWLFVPKTWDLGLDDEMPNSRTLYMTDDFKIEAKVFRADDFVNTYRSMQKKD